VNETTHQTTRQSAQEAQWEAHAKAFIAEHWPGPERLEHPGAFQLASAKWYRALAEQSWSVAHWAKQFGGAEWPKSRLYRWQMLCQKAQTPPINTLAMSLVAPLLMTEGVFDRPWSHTSRFAQ
jgi:alkylation response protein AidB-like acyl-CoA dehydrogenase